MELEQTFSYYGWSIKYTVLEPQFSRINPAELQTVVCVHGTPWSSATFVPLAKALMATATYRVLLYDLPGYGQSQEYEQSTGEKGGRTARFAGDTSVAFQAGALSELLKHLQLHDNEFHGAPHAIAHDIAGTIALRAHLVHQSEIRTLLLMDTNVVLPWGDGFYKLVRAQPEVFLQLPYAIYGAMLRAVIKSACSNPNKLQGDWEETLAHPWQAKEKGLENTVQSNFVRQIAQADDADVAELLDQQLYRQVQCPVKVLWGEDDTWIPKEKMDQLVQMLGHRVEEYVIIPEAGHLIMVDQPERVAIEVLSWLART